MMPEYITIYGRGLVPDQRKEVPKGIDPMIFGIGIAIGETQNLREEFEKIKLISCDNRGMINTITDSVKKLKDTITDIKAVKTSKIALTKDIVLVVAILTLAGKMIGWW